MKQIITTTYGQVQGHCKGEMLEFLGIPFAKPPVGELRFKRAVEVEPWDGILDCTTYKDCSMQLWNDQVIGSEDCLTLNVQRPIDGENLPVLVWIHGGGFNTGSAQDPVTAGDAYVKNGIVFVSIQYRLNVLGFYDFTTYPGCEDFDSNCAISDQIMALRWVHENIGAFGGNPENVTIMGESAGASSVINMMVAPGAKGYFQKAISESALVNCVVTHEAARENVDLFLEGMGWTETDLPKLKTMDPAELQKGNTYVMQRHQYKNPGMYLPGPIQDDLLPIRPIDALAQGVAKDVKLLIGTNRDESTIFIYPENTGFPNSWDMIQDMFARNAHQADFQRFQEYYRKQGEKRAFSQDAAEREDEICKESVRKFGTDYAFLMPSIKAAVAQSKYNAVWMFRYDLVTKSGVNSGLGASHGAELGPVFANKTAPLYQGLFDGEPEELAEKMVREMQTPWMQFIKQGDPGVQWPKWDDARNVCVFDRETRIEYAEEYKHILDVWEDLRFYEK